MINFAVEMRGDPECWGLPCTVRVYRQFGPWMGHRAVWVEPRRSRRQWVVTFAEVGRKLPGVFTLSQAVHLARFCWLRKLDPFEDADKAAIRGEIARYKRGGL